MALHIESYRGIEFVRISSLSKDEQKQVWDSFERGKIIKIVTSESLMNDCILINDFADWQAKSRHQTPDNSVPNHPAMVGKLAFE